MGVRREHAPRSNKNPADLQDEWDSKLSEEPRSGGIPDNYFLARTLLMGRRPASEHSNILAKLRYVSCGELHSRFRRSYISHARFNLHTGADLCVICVTAGFVDSPTGPVCCKVLNGQNWDISAPSHLMPSTVLTVSRFRCHHQPNLQTRSTSSPLRVQSTVSPTTTHYLRGDATYEVTRAHQVSIRPS